jgi:RimJ/RimL family protein N-acetyltransferase
MAWLGRRAAAAGETLTRRGRNGVSPSGKLNDAAMATSTIPDSVGELVREGTLVRLRTHVPANRAAFQRWYADPEIAGLLRHDQETMTDVQSRGYFDTIMLPLSARGHSYAIHEAVSDRLIGSTALTDFAPGAQSALFRIVIGEKDCWNRGYGTEATSLVMEEAFERHGLNRVRLEVFRHNERAIAVYRKVGFEIDGERVEWVSRSRFELHVVEMYLDRDRFQAMRTRGDTFNQPENITTS